MQHHVGGAVAELAHLLPRQLQAGVADLGPHLCTAWHGAQHSSTAHSSAQGGRQAQE